MKQFVPLTVVPGARRRIDSDTLMPMSDKKGNPLWDMPPPISYVEHRRTSKRGVEPVQVPVYRGASASYARYVKSQIRRNQRKAAEVAKQNSLQEVEAVLEDLVLNPGEHNVKTEQF